jgi:N-acetylglutamate synthase-like GNAT family acetyltransferase
LKKCKVNAWRTIKLVEDIIYKKLLLDDINENLLDDFNRYQEVKKSWYYDNGSWKLIEDKYIDNWDGNTKKKKIKDFFHALDEGGCIFGAYASKKLIGFSVLLNKRFGAHNQYVDLNSMHVSLDYRNNGIGKKLFQLCVEKAKEIGVEKIYISANASEETQSFYLGIGCKDAVEISTKLAEEKPEDRQMEYTI